MPLSSRMETGAFMECTAAARLHDSGATATVLPVARRGLQVTWKGKAATIAAVYASGQVALDIPGRLGALCVPRGEVEGAQFPQPSALKRALGNQAKLRAQRSAAERAGIEARTQSLAKSLIAAIGDAIAQQEASPLGPTVVRGPLVDLPALRRIPGARAIEVHMSVGTAAAKAWAFGEGERGARCDRRALRRCVRAAVSELARAKGFGGAILVFSPDKDLSLMSCDDFHSSMRIYLR